MKNKKLITIISVTLLLVVAVAGTLAWLTDRDSVANTFTVGNVDITLDEAAVDENGEPVLDPAGNPVDRVKENNYHLIPGESYVKDPTVTVEKKSEPSYVRMIVKVNCVDALDKIFADNTIALTDVFGGYDPAVWNYNGNKVVTEDGVEKRVYEFRYKEAVGTMDPAEEKVLPALFTTLTVPGAISGEEMKTIADLKIEVEGHAIQVATFESNEDGAWAAFDTHYNK